MQLLKFFSSKSPLWHFLSWPRFDLLLFRPFHKILLFSFQEKSKISLDKFEQEKDWVWQTASSCPTWVCRGQVAGARPAGNEGQGRKQLFRGRETPRLARWIRAKTGLGTWQPPGENLAFPCHENQARASNSTWSFRLCFFANSWDGTWRDLQLLLILDRNSNIVLKKVLREQGGAGWTCLKTTGLFIT